MLRKKVQKLLVKHHGWRMLLVSFAEGFCMPRPNCFLTSDIDFCPWWNTEVCQEMIPSLQHDCAELNVILNSLILCYILSYFKSWLLKMLAWWLLVLLMLVLPWLRMAHVPTVWTWFRESLEHSSEKRKSVLSLTISLKFANWAERYRDRRRFGGGHVTPAAAWSNVLRLSSCSFVPLTAPLPWASCSLEWAGN